MTQLPGAASATVDEAKIRVYLLDPAHPRNGGKAGFFLSFGFHPTRWTEMAAAFLRHPLTNSVTATSTSVHGGKHVVRCSIQTPDGRNPCITTVWMTQPGHHPRLITAYP
jgi:hypothetical protein